jgi:hypothetical protein
MRQRIRDHIEVRPNLLRSDPRQRPEVSRQIRYRSRRRGSEEVRGVPARWIDQLEEPPQLEPLSRDPRRGVPRRPPMEVLCLNRPQHGRTLQLTTPTTRVGDLTVRRLGFGANEELLAEALHPYADGLVIATKIGHTRPSPGEWKPVGRPEYLRQAADLSLRRLAWNASIYCNSIASTRRSLWRISWAPSRNSRSKERSATSACPRSLAIN